jgi:CRISPR-associated endonuclease Cas1
MAHSKSDGNADWVRLRASVHCTRRPGLHQWLPFTIRALIRSVVKTPFTFHPWQGEHLPDFPEPGSTTAIEMLLTNLEAKSVTETCRRLESLSFDDYRLTLDGPPEKRRIGDLLEERGGGFRGLGEVCLDFLSPLILAPEPLREENLPDAKKFLRILEARVRAVGCGGLWPESQPSVELIPWHMRMAPVRSRPSKSQPGHREFLRGVLGPLLVRGDLETLLPLLLLVEELHLGRSLAVGCGHCRLIPNHAVVDEALGRWQLWAAQASMLRDDPEHAGEWLHPSAPDDTELQSLCAEVAKGRFPSEPAKLVAIPKSGGQGVRHVGKLAHRTYLFHRVLAKLLGPAIDRRLSPAALAYRPGKSTRLARPFLTHAIDAGCTHVAKADIASFFDEIPWPRLEECIGAFLPAGDRLAREALRAAWSLPFEGKNRSAGILQGSPLSPLLANLFLAGWDDAMAARGHHHIRYGDDVLIAAAGEAGAATALQDATGLLEPLGLRLQPEKTAVLPIAEGFRHLGLDLGGEDGDILETSKPALRRTLYLTRVDEWAGLDHEALLLREGGKLIHRLPLLQIAQIVSLGIGGFSTALLSACTHRGIPVTIADRSGHHCGTLHAEPRKFFRAVEAHARARAALGDNDLIRLCREILQAKLSGYLGWADSLLPPASTAIRTAAKAGLDSLKTKNAVDSFLGIEGSTARNLLGTVNALCRDPIWKSDTRQPHARRDPWNLLLDTISFLLFTRINALLRGVSLDPFLGFLHSPDDRFESLVCDLQEPFRARCERLAVRLGNLNLLQPQHTSRLPDGTWTWGPGGWHAIITEFERELDRRRTPDRLDWRTQIHHIVEAVRLWALDPRHPLSLIPPGSAPPHP